MRTAIEIASWQGYLKSREVEILKESAKLVCKENHQPIFVNIGAGAGTSTLCFLESAKNSLVFSVDILTNEAEITTNEHLRLAECGEEYLSRVIKVWGDSKNVGKAWPEAFEVDYVFIDGDHSYEGCAGDIHSWVVKIKRGGLIAFHDYTSNNWPGVKKAVDELMDFYKCKEIAYTNPYTVRVFQVK